MLKNKILGLMAVGVVLLSSCSSSKTSLTYFEDIKATQSVVDLPEVQPVKLSPDDELFITVTSDEPAATAPFNLPTVNIGVKEQIAAQQSPKQQTYVVDSRGYIDFPQLGRIHVAGMTTEQLRDDLIERISEWVKDPNVYVQIVNFRVNVLGEVTKPGRVDVSRNRYSILDAIADAGDLTPYGERKNVLLIREKDGVQQRVLLDLNSSELLTSPYFYLQPNDYIYVQPNNVRIEQAKYNQNNGYKLQVISTIVSASSVIASLVIALAVK